MSVGRLRRWAVVTSLAAACLLLLSVVAFAATAGSNPPNSVVLQQLLNGQLQCTSPDATCTVVNLLGIDGNPNSPPLDPSGEVRTTTVELVNAGNVPSNLTITPGACTSQNLNPALGNLDLCAGTLVAVTCVTAGTTMSLGPQTLAAFGQAGTLLVTDALAAGASSTCTFTVTYPAPNPTSALLLKAVLPVTWTLTESTTTPPTTTPPTTTPPTTTPTTPPTTAPTPSPAAPAPGVAAPSSVPGPLAVTGSYALVLLLTGLALLVTGQVLSRVARRRERRESGENASVG